MLRKVTSLLLLLGMLAVAGIAHAGDRAGAFSISPYIGGFVFDDHQQADLRQNRVTYGFRMGYDFTDHFGAEVVGSYVRPEYKVGDSHFNDWLGHMDLLYNFMPQSRLVPYLVVGGGVQSMQYTRGAGEQTDGIFNVGAGFKLFLSDDVALRFDGRHIFDYQDDQETIHNWEYSAGLSFLFGGTKKAAEVVAAPAPAAEPAPAPVAEPAPQEAPLAPVPAAEPTPGHYKYCETLHIEFDVDRAIVRPEFYPQVNKVCDFMKKYPDTTGVIEGHTDNVGSPEHNMELSQRRAQAVVDYMVQNCGIDRSRLTAKGFGMTRPVADNATDEGKQKNRRIEAVIDCVTQVKEAQPPARMCMHLALEFPTGSADISPEYRSEIAKVADYMKQYPTTTGVIEGHTDNVGNPEANMRLSQKRAQNVVDYLVNNLGIERSRLTAKGYGSTRRIAYNKTPEGRALNRRVNAVIDCVVKP
jgi:OmpA-OmpF porin, OOP family